MQLTKQENQQKNKKASYCIVLAGEAHTIVKSLIKPVIADVASFVFDEEFVEQLKLVSLFINTVARKIYNIASNIETRNIFRICDCNAYALPLDESADVADWKF